MQQGERRSRLAALRDVMMRGGLAATFPLGLLSACSFEHGKLGPTDGGVDAASDAATCATPMVIDDQFDNTDLATAGPLSIGTGFMAVTNANTGNGSSVEQSGGVLAISTANNNPPQAPAQGAVSNASFAFDPAGMTVRLDVTAADTAIWNGIALSLQSNQANIDGAGGSLVLRIRGQGTNTFQVDMGDQMTYATPLGLQPYDEVALADGFVVTWKLDANSWSYVVDGLLANGAPISDSGGYVSGESPADLLDQTTHLGIHIQGNPNDTNPRVLRVKRLTLWHGRCP